MREFLILFWLFILTLPAIAQEYTTDSNTVGLWHFNEVSALLPMMRAETAITALWLGQ